MNFDTAIILGNLGPLIRGVETTIWLFFAIMGLCTPLALLVALARLSRNRALRTAGARLRQYHPIPAAAGHPVLYLLRVPGPRHFRVALHRGDDRVDDRDDRPICRKTCAAR